MGEREGDRRGGAACRKVDPELFFPVGSVTSGPGFEQAEKAKKVCGSCEVKEDCLLYAIEHDQDAGIWGGLTEDERRAIKRRNNRAQRQNRLARGAMATESVY